MSNQVEREMQKESIQQESTQQESTQQKSIQQESIQQESIQQKSTQQESTQRVQRGKSTQQVQEGKNIEQGENIEQVQKTKEYIDRYISSNLQSKFRVIQGLKQTLGHITNKNAAEKTFPGCVSLVFIKHLLTTSNVKEDDALLEEIDSAVMSIIKRVRGESVKSGSKCTFCFSNTPKHVCPCKQAYYCDRRCQESHWVEHKKLCKREGKNESKRQGEEEEVNKEEVNKETSHKHN